MPNELFAPTVQQSNWVTVRRSSCVHSARKAGNNAKEQKNALDAGAETQQQQHQQQAGASPVLSPRAGITPITIPFPMSTTSTSPPRSIPGKSKRRRQNVSCYKSRRDVRAAVQPGGTGRTQPTVRCGAAAMAAMATAAASDGKQVSSGNACSVQRAKHCRT